MQAQRQSKPRPAAEFQLHESEGMQDLLSLMQNMCVGAGETAELPQANGDMSSHPHPIEGAAAVEMMHVTLALPKSEADCRWCS